MPPPSPPPNPPLGNYNGLAAIGYSFMTLNLPSAAAVALAVDNNQQIHRIARVTYPQGSSQTGLEPWSAPAVLPGVYVRNITPGIAVSSSTLTTDGEQTILANAISCGIGTDFACYAIVNGLVKLGGVFQTVQTPVMTSWPNGRIDVFLIDGEGHVQQQTMIDGNLHWEPSWTDLGEFTDVGSLAAGIACAPNLIDLVARDSRGELRLFSWNGSAWGQTDLQFQSDADPALASCAPGRLDVLALNTAGVLYHRFRTGQAWSSWQLVGETRATWAKPAVASWGTNRLDVVVVGSDDAFYHKSYDGSQWLPAGATTWEALGGKLNTRVAPVIAAPMTNWLEVFVKGTDSKWYSNSFYGSSWAGWVSHDVVLN